MRYLLTLIAFLSFATFAFTEEKEQKAYYEKWNGDLRELLETFVIVERLPEELEEHESVFVFERHGQYAPLRKKNMTHPNHYLFEISAIPSSVKVVYSEANVPFDEDGNTIWRYVGFTIKRHSATQEKFEVIPVNQEERDGSEATKCFIGSHASVFVSLNAGFTDEQFEMIMDSLRTKKPLTMKGTLVFPDGKNDTLERVRFTLNNWNIKFVPAEINGVPVNGYGEFYALH